MEILKSYSDSQCTKFLVIEHNSIVAYYYEHNVHPETGEKFEKPVYEFYYDEQDGQFDEILITEDFEEIEGILDSMWT